MSNGEEKYTFLRSKKDIKRLEEVKELLNGENKYPNIFFPGLAAETQGALGSIPIAYRVMRYPQMCIIRLNMAELMQFPYTSFNLKHRIGFYFHRSALKVIDKGGKYEK